MEWYLVMILSQAASIGKHICMYTSCAPVRSCQHNLQQGGMIMLHKLLPKHETLVCHIMTDIKKQSGHFGPFYATSAIQYFFAMPFLAMA